MNIVLKFWYNEKGATAIEYGLIVALIAVAIIGSLNNFGNAMGDMYNTLETTIGDQF